MLLIIFIFIQIFITQKYKTTPSNFIYHKIKKFIVKVIMINNYNRIYNFSNFKLHYIHMIGGILRTIFW